MTPEQWKDIPGYEGLYQASNSGNIRSYYYGYAKTLTPCTSGVGYTRYVLCKNGVKRHIRGHKLIMLTFMGEYPPGMEVNHKNGVRDDNRLENLEYVSKSENHKHRCSVLGNKPVSWKSNTFFSKEKPATFFQQHNKSVIQFSKKGKIIAEWDSISIASRSLHISASHISGCCLKRDHYNTAGGFKWSYKELL